MLALQPTSEDQELENHYKNLRSSALLGFSFQTTHSPKDEPEFESEWAPSLTVVFMIRSRASDTVADIRDNDDYLYLDEGEESGKALLDKQEKRLKKDDASPLEDLAAPQIDVDISSAVDDNIAENVTEKLTPFDDDLAILSLGVQKARWPLSGMDCPDCAMKATRAIQRLDSVSECSVSATQGSVDVEINLEHGNLAQLNSILSSLGHAPEVEWFEIVGVKASRLRERLSMDGRSLARMLKNQPGLLDVELSNDDRELVQVPSN